VHYPYPLKDELQVTKRTLQRFSLQDTSKHTERGRRKRSFGTAGRGTKPPGFVHRLSVGGDGRPASGTSRQAGKLQACNCRSCGRMASLPTHSRRHLDLANELSGSMWLVSICYWTKQKQKMLPAQDFFCMWLLYR
jgi:hypothetical protein